MSFNHYARKVHDPTRPLGQRRSALGSCLLRLGWLTGQKYSAMCRHFQINFSAEVMTDQILRQKILEIELARNQFLHQLQAYERKRIREKMRGQRHPRQRDIKALYVWPISKK